MVRNCKRSERRESHGGGGDDTQGYERFMIAGQRLQDDGGYHGPYGGYVTELHVMMLRPGDADYDKGIDARETLGPEWQRLSEEGIRTCPREPL